MIQSNVDIQGNKKNEQAVEDWDMVIKPQSALLQLNFSEVWQYKDLLFLFVKRDFISQYKQTILGPVWHFIQPILTTLMFLIVFGKIAQIPTDNIKPQLLFYMSGIVMWNYFASCVTGTSNTFVSNAGIFGKVYFPRLVLPLSVVISNIIRFGIQFLLLISFCVYYHFNGYPFIISSSLLLIPCLLIHRISQPGTPLPYSPR